MALMRPCVSVYLGGSAEECGCVVGVGRASLTTTAEIGESVCCFEVNIVNVTFEFEASFFGWEN